LKVKPDRSSDKDLEDCASPDESKSKSLIIPKSKSSSLKHYWTMEEVTLNIV